MCYGASMPTGNGDRSRPSDGAAQLGGVRADFVANLGRRLAEVRRHWSSLEVDPGSPRARDEVRRRVHALAVRARVVGLIVVADRLDQAERSLERAATVGGIDRDDVQLFRSLFEDLPALAWQGDSSTQAELGTKPPPRNDSVSAAPTVCPLAVLVVGDRALASSICSAEPADRMTAIECEHTDDLATATDLARAFAPDVILLDADLAGADGLLDRLAADSLTAAVPVVVVGSWEFPDQAAPFLTRGVAQALARPVSSSRMRTAITDAARLPRPVDTAVQPLDGTVIEIADRLADHVRRGLVDALQPSSRGAHVQLGDGAEALAAVWGAIARVREILAARSGGAVTFSADGPVGAMPLAPWLDQRTDPLLARREASSRQQLDTPTRLDGRRILVIDDDPAVCWFFGDLFRRSGAEVAEAHDGTQGLESAMRLQPNLVVSDILMPGLDGFALCRALKNDVLLRDVPVILLSWKEDLLQRVRELGASADGYLRKEASSPAVLRKVHEVLRPRIRLEERLQSGAEVRGRLDGWTALSLLRLVAASRPGGLIVLRDANHLYELTLREGRLIRASRTSLDGTTLHDAEALASLPGVTSGRFQVTSGGAAAGGEELDGALSNIVARARAACALLTGSALQTVQRVKLRVPELALAATPEPARTWMRAIADGIAPIELCNTHDVPRSMLERLLADAAMRGAVEAVLSAEGDDLLSLETAAQASKAFTPTQPGVSPPPAPAAAVDRAQAQGEPAAAHVDLSVDALLGDNADAPHAPSQPDTVFSTPPPNYLDALEAGEAPTSLAEAVIREVADAHGSMPPPSSRTPFLVDVQELRPRTRPPGPMTGSLPPDAVVPGAEAGDADAPAAEPTVPSAPSFPPPAKPPVGLANPIVRTPAAPEPSARTPHDEPLVAPRAPSGALAYQPAHDTADAERQLDALMQPRAGATSRRWPTLVLLAIVVAAVVAVAKLAVRNNTETGSAAPSGSGSRALPAASLVAPDASSPGKTPRVESELSLPEDMHVAPGMSVIEVRPGQQDAIVFVDGTEVGSGDVVRSMVPPGEHDVIVEGKGVELKATVVASATRRTRVSMEGLWAP